MIKLNFKKLYGLIPVVVQDYKTNEVLMLAFMNKEAWNKTLATGNAHYYSRARKMVWMKGETSGNIQKVKEIYIDCDQDSILLKVEQKVAACHLGYKSCFFKKIKDNEIIIAKKRIFNPEEVYKK